MIGSRRTFPGPARWRAALPASGWRDVGGALPLAAALTLWAAVIAGALAPLSGALARLDGPARANERAQVASCGVPDGALASSAPALVARACR